MPINLPETKQPRIVIAGSGFAGLTLAKQIGRALNLGKTVIQQRLSGRHHRSQ